MMITRFRKKSPSELMIGARFVIYDREKVERHVMGYYEKKELTILRRRNLTDLFFFIFRSILT
jgi:hypothetical protein